MIAVVTGIVLIISKCYLLESTLLKNAHILPLSIALSFKAL